MKLILFLLIFFPTNILCKSQEYESTDEDESMDSQRRKDCAKNEFLFVLDKLLDFKEDFSKQLEKAETRHLEEMNVMKSEHAKAETKHLEEMNVVKNEVDVVKSEVDVLKSELAKAQIEHSQELAKVHVKHSEELAEVKIRHLTEINALKDDVAMAKTSCSDEVKLMEIKMTDARNVVEKENKIVQEEFGKVRNELSIFKKESSEELETIKEEVEDARNKHSSLASEITIVQDKNLEIESALEEKSMAIFSVFSNSSGNLATNSFIGFDYNYIENRGNNFDLKNGIFTAPYKGIYEFAFTGHSPSNGGTYIQALKNGLEINEFYGHSKGYTNMSPSWICSLEKGDTIRMKLNHSTQLFTNVNMYRTFSGKLLSHSP